MGPLTDPLPQVPAAERNKQPILDVLARVLPPAGLVLEIASGTGQHVVHFAEALPGLAFQPSEADPAMLDITRRRVEAAALPNVRSPVALDVLETPWPIDRAEAIVVINLLHISPWAVTPALFRSAAQVLPAGAPLAVYGPFIRAKVPTAPSNVQFDESLKARDPEWGLRRVEDVSAAAEEQGFELAELVEMPANNLVLVFRRR